MSDRYKGAILSPTAPTVTPQSAGGIYTSSQQLQYQGQGVWPQAVNNPLTNSLRFRSSASASLSRTPASASNRTTWTFSAWIKRGNVSTSELTFFSAGADGNNFTAFAWNNNNLFFQNYTSGSQVTATSTAVFRDPSAWYHVVLAIDTTQATAANRAILYVNGVQQAGFSGASFTQNQQFWINFTYGHRIGARQLSSADSFTDQYMGEVNFVDGTQLTPSSFGTTDAYGIWQPIPYTGAYGTNGFYLPFYNSSTLGTSVTANYLVVAGGGSGQGSGFQYVYGGGGGAGGLLTGTTTLNSAANYTITVGAGGSGVSGTDSPGNNGSNSTAFGLTAIGGSGGRSALGGGGSGGGAGSYGGGNTSGTSGQGNSGGTATAYGATASGGGGGGAGAAGGNGSSGAGGAGGAGTASSISGSSVTYAGGGGGAGSSSGGAGGAGGGGAGAGAAGNGTNGTANTGGGGGAAATTSGGNQTSGAGGSGIVIVSYAGSQRYVGGTVTTSGGNTIHTFTSSGTLTVLGNDFSGNGNNWTLNNISLTPGVTYDSMKDVPTNTNSNTANYATGSPVASYSNNITWTNGNLALAIGLSAEWRTSMIPFQLLSNKWYWEITLTATVNSGDLMVGVINSDIATTVISGNSEIGTQTFGYAYYSGGLRINAGTNSAYGATWFTSGDIIGVTFDASSGDLSFYKNGVSQGLAYTVNMSKTYVPAISGTRSGGTTPSVAFNFGQQPFSYTPPTGFLPLNTYNLPTPTILAGNKYMDATTFTAPIGVGGTQGGRNGGNSGSGGQGAGFSGVLSSSGTQLVIAAGGGGGGGGGGFGGGNNGGAATAGGAGSGAGGSGYSGSGSGGSMTNGSGGGGAGGSDAGSGTSGGGAGGTNVLTGTNTTSTNGSGTSVANSGDPNYVANRGNGGATSSTGTSSGNTGQNGLVWIQYPATGGTTATYSSAAETLFTVPAGITSLRVKAWGAGGSSGFGAVSATGGAGGGGGFAQADITVTPGQVLTIVVGTGGRQYGSKSITNAASFQPDFVWFKDRTSAYDHILTDSVRGVNNSLVSNSTNAQSSTTLYLLSAFNSNGFNVSSSAGAATLNDNLVGWQWRASNVAGVSNTNGTITSTVSANTTAGFSIVRISASGSSGSIGHGLGVAPSMIIGKNTASADDWYTYHISIGTGAFIRLNTTAAQSSSSSAYTNINSSTFTAGSGVLSNNAHVFYCFSAVAGYSAFGSYTGNGSSDGPFVYTGFRPRWIMVKPTNVSGEYWQIIDTSRNPYNASPANMLSANLSDAEAAIASQTTDILSNGFKFRGTGGGTNGSGTTYIYACFAENPFKIARGR